MITKPEVERKLLQRLRKKAAIYAQEFSADGDAIVNSHLNGSAKIDVDGVVELYESYIIPLTKEVEVRVSLYAGRSSTYVFCQVDYLLHRLDGLSQEEIDALTA